MRRLTSAIMRRMLVTASTKWRWRGRECRSKGSRGGWRSRGCGRRGGRKKCGLLWIVISSSSSTGASGCMWKSSRNADDAEQ
jgi:hypothetical protein